jgi:large subunit ribosomal protein L34
MQRSYSPREKLRSGKKHSMPKRTFQPKKKTVKKVHGFMKRMASKAGIKILKARRLKNRTQLSK